MLRPPFTHPSPLDCISAHFLDYADAHTPRSCQLDLYLPYLVEVKFIYLHSRYTYNSSPLHAPNPNTSPPHSVKSFSVQDISARVFVVTTRIRPHILPCSQTRFFPSFSHSQGLLDTRTHFISPHYLQYLRGAPLLS